MMKYSYIDDCCIKLIESRGGEVVWGKRKKENDEENALENCCRTGCKYLTLNFSNL